MKTAICFSGLVGSTRGKSDDRLGGAEECLKISSDQYKKHIIDKNDVDIFVHSWSTDLEDKIISTYNPKKYKIEKQIVFDTPDYPILKKTGEKRKQVHYSLQYSRMMSIQLKSEYEKEQGFKYDCVMPARFDLAWQSDLIFSEYDQNYIWAAKWPKKYYKGKMLHDFQYWKMSQGGTLDANPSDNEKFKNKWWGYPHNDHGLLGTWFFSNSETMDKFGTLYNKLDKYSLPDKCPLDTSDRMSAHRQALYHIKELGLIDKLKFTDKNWHDDCPSVRRKYFQEK